MRTYRSRHHAPASQPPAPGPRPHHQSVLGVQVPASEVAARAERIRESLLADGGFQLTEPVEHGAAPITASRDPGLPAFLEAAWADARRVMHPRDALAPETIRSAWATEGMSPDVPREPAHVHGRAGHRAWSPRSFIAAGTCDASRRAVDVALAAVDLVLDGGEPAAHGLCGPPGHHAGRSMYGGFCCFNNAAIAAQAIAGRRGGPAVGSAARRGACPGLIGALPSAHDERPARPAPVARQRPPHRRRDRDRDR